MENIDLIVLRTLLQWRLVDVPSIFVVVVGTWGSSPRPIGSIMAMSSEGKIVGSVSGGCVEDDLLNHYIFDIEVAASWRTNNTLLPELVQYGVTAQEAHKLGLPCGGTLELLLEFNPSAKLLTELLNSLSQGRLVERQISLLTGEVSLAQVTDTQFQINERSCRMVFGPAYKMLLIGGGQLAEYLATMALFCGFSVCICDPRSEYKLSSSLKGVEFISKMPDDAVKELGVDGRTCIVTLSHDPKLDDLALIEALQSPAFYVGAIGSRKNHATRSQRLRTHFNLQVADLQKLRAPVGIFLASKTPAEIAVSIMAEIIACKNAVNDYRTVTEGKSQVEDQQKGIDYAESPLVIFD